MKHRHGTFIFDFDNTVVYSNEDHIKSYMMSAREFGLKMKKDEVRKLFGRSAEEIFKELYPQLSKKELKRIHARKEVLYRKIIADKPLKPIGGIKKTLHYLHERDAKIAIVSSASVKNIKIGMKRLGLGKYFQAIVGAEDVKHHKPNPEALIKAMKKLRSKPSDCVFVGDAKYDMMAARRAKVTGIGVATGFYKINDLKRNGGKYAFKNHLGILTLLKSGRI